MAVIAVYVRRREAPARADPAPAQPGQPGAADPRALQEPPRRGRRRRCRPSRSRTSSRCATSSPCCSAPRWCGASPRRSRATSSSSASTVAWCGSSSRSYGRRRGRPPPGDPGLLPRGRRAGTSTRRSTALADARHRRPARPQGGRPPRCTCPRGADLDDEPAAPRLPPAVEDPPPARAGHRPHRRPLRQPAEDHAGHDRRPRRRRRRRRDPGPGHQGGPVPPRRDQHPRPLHADRRPASLGPCASTLPVRHAGRARPPRRRARRPPGLVIAPDIMGLRPLFDDHGQRGWPTSTAGRWCAVEPFPGHEDLAARRRASSRSAPLDDAALLGDLVAAADQLEVRAGRRARASAWAACTR